MAGVTFGSDTRRYFYLLLSSPPPVPDWYRIKINGNPAKGSPEEEEELWFDWGVYFATNRIRRTLNTN